MRGASDRAAIRKASRSLRRAGPDQACRDRRELVGTPGSTRGGSAQHQPCSRQEPSTSRLGRHRASARGAGLAGACKRKSSDPAGALEDYLPLATRVVKAVSHRESGARDRRRLLVREFDYDFPPTPAVGSAYANPWRARPRGAFALIFFAGIDSLAAPSRPYERVMRADFLSPEYLYLVARLLLSSAKQLRVRRFTPLCSGVTRCRPSLLGELKETQCLRRKLPRDIFLNY